MITINKELNRPDGGKVASGSIIKYNTRFNADNGYVVWFYLNHFVDVASFDSGKEKVHQIDEFSYTQYKECTQAEWDSLNDAGSAVLVESWLKDILELELGEGNVTMS